jgi:hypothetical protein
MPVDHPDKPLEQRLPPAHGRKINAAIGFVVVLGALLALVPLLNIGGFMS